MPPVSNADCSGDLACLCGALHTQAAADGRDLGPDIIGGAARNAFMLLLWRLNGLDREDPEADELRELADARWRTTTLLETTLEASQQVGHARTYCGQIAAGFPAAWT